MVSRKTKTNLVVMYVGILIMHGIRQNKTNYTHFYRLVNSEFSLYFRETLW